MNAALAGSRLKELRERFRYSQRELAEATGVSKPWIAKFELGNIKSPGLDTLELLASAFGMNKADFFHALGIIDQAPAERDQVARTILENEQQRATPVDFDLDRTRTLVRKYLSEYPALADVFLDLLIESVGIPKTYDELEAAFRSTAAAYEKRHQAHNQRAEGQ